MGGDENIGSGDEAHSQNTFDGGDEMSDCDSLSSCCNNDVDAKEEEEIFGNMSPGFGSFLSTNPKTSPVGTVRKKGDIEEGDIEEGVQLDPIKERLIEALLSEIGRTGDEERLSRLSNLYHRLIKDPVNEFGLVGVAFVALMTVIAAPSVSVCVPLAGQAFEKIGLHNSIAKFLIALYGTIPLGLMNMNSAFEFFSSLVKSHSNEFKELFKHFDVTNMSQKQWVDLIANKLFKTSLLVVAGTSAIPNAYKTTEYNLKFAAIPSWFGPLINNYFLASRIIDLVANSELMQVYVAQQYRKFTYDHDAFVESQKIATILYCLSKSKSVLSAMPHDEFLGIAKDIISEDFNSKIDNINFGELFKIASMQKEGGNYFIAKGISGVFALSATLSAFYYFSAGENGAAEIFNNLLFDEAIGYTGSVYNVAIILYTAMSTALATGIPYKIEDLAWWLIHRPQKVYGRFFQPESTADERTPINGDERVAEDGENSKKSWHIIAKIIKYIVSSVGVGGAVAGGMSNVGANMDAGAKWWILLSAFLSQAALNGYGWDMFQHKLFGVFKDTELTQTAKLFKLIELIESDIRSFRPEIIDFFYSSLPEEIKDKFSFPPEEEFYDCNDDPPTGTVPHL